MKVNRKLSFVIGPQSGIRPRRKDLIPANDSPWPDPDLLLFVHSLEITFFSFTANFALPEEDKEAVVPTFVEITFVELDREEAKKIVEQYNKVGLTYNSVQA